MSIDLIHIHEDDERLRNLYPLAAWAQASADLKASVEASERNRDPSGHGWTAVHVIGKPTITYADSGLRVLDVAKISPRELPRIRRFYMTAAGGFDSSRPRDPYDSYDEDAWCFGTGPSCYVKLDVVGDLVTGIWFEGRFSNDDDLTLLRQIFVAIDRLVPSAIVDYPLSLNGPVSDPKFLEQYFSALSSEDH